MESKKRREKGRDGQGTAKNEKEQTGQESIPRLQWLDLSKRVMERIRNALMRLGLGIRRAFASLMQSEGDIRLVDDIKDAFKHVPFGKRGLAYGLLGLVLAAYLLSGVYTVKPGEEAVARIFGREVRGQINEGLHYRLPWPLEAVDKVNVMEIRRVDIGIPVSEEPLLFPKKASTRKDPGAHGEHDAHTSSPQDAEVLDKNRTATNSQFLTGDENIIEIRMNIQYRVKDASDYLFNANSPDSLVPYSAKVAVTEIFGGMRVDDLLTVAKSQMQKKIAHKVQNMLDEYGAGLQIVNVNLQEVNPPEEAAQAFRDVASAKEEREETINKAHGYWNTVVPEARGKAHQTISDAEGYREEVINQARGDSEKFSAMLAEYRGAKEVTEYRLYLETIERIFTKTKKFVVDSRKERVNLKFVK